MRITSKGQVTIPARIREQAGLLPHQALEEARVGGDLRLGPGAVVGLQVFQHDRGHRRPGREGQALSMPDRPGDRRPPRPKAMEGKQ